LGTPSDCLDVNTCPAVREGARLCQMYHIGSYKDVFRPCHPPWEPRKLDTWSECTANVQSARLGPDSISREYRRGRSGIPVSRRYLRNVARCTVERPSKRPSSYLPKLSNMYVLYVLQASPSVSVLATSGVFGSDPATAFWLTVQRTFIRSSTVFLHSCDISSCARCLVSNADRPRRIGQPLQSFLCG